MVYGGARVGSDLAMSGSEHDDDAFWDDQQQSEHPPRSASVVGTGFYDDLMT